MRTLTGQLTVGAAALLIVSNAVLPPSLHPTSVPQVASDPAARLLAAARGANPVMCELAVGAVDRRYGGWSGGEYAPDTDAEVRELLQQAAEDALNVATIPLLREALADSDPCVRRVASRLLGRGRHPRAVAALRDALRHPDRATRRVAAVGLGYAETRDAVEPLVRALGDEAAAVRAAAAWALGVIEDPRAVEPLTRALAEDRDPSVRRQAARALGRMY